MTTLFLLLDAGVCSVACTALAMPPKRSAKTVDSKQLRKQQVSMVWMKESDRNMVGGKG